jgi:hypothetical protein
MQIVENGGDGVDALVSAYSRFLNNSILVNGAMESPAAFTVMLRGTRLPTTDLLESILAAAQCSATRYFPMSGLGYMT